MSTAIGTISVKKGVVETASYKGYDLKVQGEALLSKIKAVASKSFENLTDYQVIIKSDNSFELKRIYYNIFGFQTYKLTSIGSSEKAILAILDRTILPKRAISAVDYIFRKQIIPSKLADIATIFLLGSLLIASIAIFHPILPAVLAINAVAAPIFGGLNLLVGAGVMTQAVMNYKNAKNREQKIQAVITAIFGAVICFLGVSSLVHFSNPIVFKGAFALCSSFVLGLGFYNLSKVVKAKNLIKEVNDLKALKSLVKDENNKLLLESVIGKELVASINKAKEEDYLELIETIKKELNKRMATEGLRIFSAALSVSAFVESNLLHTASAATIYYAMMLMGTLSSFWMNYFPSLRNAPAEEESVPAIDKSPEAVQGSYLDWVFNKINSLVRQPSQVYQPA